MSINAPSFFQRYILARIVGPVILLCGVIFLTLPYLYPSPDQEERDRKSIPPLPGWKIVWFDEFNGSGLPSSKKWGYESGFVRNKEEQYYTVNRLENARQEKGCLIIEGRKEDFPNPDYSPKATEANWQQSRKTAAYTSAALITLDKMSWKYGKIEIRAQLPKGKGSWPAFWMMGANVNAVGWPICGELDIMEFVSGTPTTIYGTVHWNKTAGTRDHITKGFSTTSPSITDDFHLYGIEWDQDKITFLLDEKPYGHFDISEATKPGMENPFQKPMYLILNLALGGSWGGEIGDDQFPRKLIIDYVRIYEKDPQSLLNAK